MKKILLITLLGFIIFLLASHLAQAAGKNEQDWCSDLSIEERSGGFIPCGRSCDDPTTPRDETLPCTFCHFFVMLDRIIDFLLIYIVPSLAALMIAIGGGMYIISRGDPEMLGRAKKLFTAIVIGLLIIYGAWLIVNLFLTTIGVTIWQGGGHWWEINCDTTPGPSPGTGTPSGTPPGTPPSACATDCTKCSEAECSGSSADCVWTGSRCVSACSQDCTQCEGMVACLNDGPNCAWTKAWTCKPSSCSSDCTECSNKLDCENVGTNCEWTSSGCILILCSMNCFQCSNKSDCENVGTNCEWTSSGCIQSPCSTNCLECSNKRDCENVGTNCKWEVIYGTTEGCH